MMENEKIENPCIYSKLLKVLYNKLLKNLKMDGRLESKRLNK